jgi:hypothetical protein
MTVEQLATKFQRTRTEIIAEVIRQALVPAYLR